MNEQGPNLLSPEEAGAFAAQWAEQHPVDPYELGRKLGVDEATSDSLLRQARGRISMQNWLASQKTSSQSISNVWLFVVGALITGVAVGACVMTIWHPFGHETAVPSEVSPKVEVVTTDEPASSPQGATRGVPPDVQVPHRDGNSASSPQPGDPPQTIQEKEKRLEEHRPKPVGGGSVMMGQSSKAPLLGLSTIAPHPRFHPEASDASLPVFDITRTLRVRIPNDLDIEMLLPDKKYVLHGVRVGDAKGARALHEQDFLRPIQQCLLYALTREKMDGSIKAKPTLVPIVRLRLIMGAADTFSQLPWDAKHRDSLITISRASDSLVFTTLIRPLMSQIKDLGGNLFPRT